MIEDCMLDYLTWKIEEGFYKRVLFVPTGALMSTISYNEGQSVPGIAHCVVIERIDGGVY